MSESAYRPRIVDAQLQQFLRAFGAVCIEGPKWCGKTSTAREISSSAVYIGDPAQNFVNRQLAQLQPAVILDGKTPRLIDEWQEYPPLWDAVRYRVDELGKKGLYILTGSSTPNHKGILHSGAGRIGRLRMRPMSLWESGDSDGKVSLEALCKGQIEPAMTGDVDLRNLIHLIVRGGWPGALSLDSSDAQLIAQQYITAVLEDDATRIDGVERDRNKLERLLKSLARQESTTASASAIQRDVSEFEQLDISRPTLANYLDVFDRLFLTDNQPPFAPSVRSSQRLKQAVKRHFCDPSLTAAILRIGPEALLYDLKTLGFLFEALCERDLRIYAESFGGNLFHYQDYKNQEIDAVISLPDGSWAAFEIKLGAGQIDAAAKNLLKIQASLKSENPNSSPSVLCVLCSLSNAAYQRPDGVFVVPLTSLKP